MVWSLLLKARILFQVSWLLEAADLGRCLPVSPSWRTWVSYGAGPKHWDPLARLALVPSTGLESASTCAAGTVASPSTNATAGTEVDLTDFRLHVEEVS